MVICKQVSWIEISIGEEFCTTTWKIAVLVKMSESTYVIKSQERQWKVYTITDEKKYILDREVLDVVEMLQRYRRRY